jgi:acyl-coenzyme A synthetase/AMP-(fatty) acid ligase
MLKESSFPTLRYSLFCGEPLTYLAAELWQKAANNSILENLYGPTEVTIACLFYRFDLGISKEIRHYKTVPIGEPNPGLAISIVDSNLNLVPQGESGELCLSGPQVVPGYWYNEEKAAQQFVHMPWDTGYSDRWYRTGDLVKIGKDGMVHYIGRIDNQVKILGYRVELEEIEEVLRQFLGQDSVVALAWPVNSDTPVGIIAFIVETRFSDKDCIEYCASKLPEYMVPREIRFIKKMPLNSNGKINRSKLLSMLEQEK